MMTFIDKLLNRITMYRLVLYVLIGLLVVADALAFIHKLPFTGVELFASSLFLVAACFVVNRIFAWGFEASPHDESAYITALILALIITPFRTQADLALLIWAPILAMAGKYIVARHRQHLFNPAALAVALTSLVIGQSASWWIGTPWMLLPALLGGYLIVRKIRRFELVVSYLVVTLASAVAYAVARHTSALISLKLVVVYSPIVFFASVMLTEPCTLPPTRRLRILFGAIVGFLSASFVHLGSFYFTPEVALLSGNLLGWLATRRERYVLTLRTRIQIAPSIMDLVFDGPRLPMFTPGQYLEWSLPHEKNDSRGSRRYFTIASSPTEPGLRMGVKFYQPMSTYKQELLHLQPGDRIIAEQLDGDFILPGNKKQHLVFIAGGIGITPFRSMIKYLLDRKEVRPLTLFYANQVKNDIVYEDVIEQAGAELGMKTIYLLSDQKNIPADWIGQRGFLTGQMIEEEVPHFDLAHYYLSGPQGMVTAYVKVLHKLGIPGSRITTDYFPGFA